MLSLAFEPSIFDACEPEKETTSPNISLQTLTIIRREKVKIAIPLVMNLLGPETAVSGFQVLRKITSPSQYVFEFSIR